MKNPAVRPTPSLFIESLVTTFPARRRVRGAMIVAVGAHLLAGTALYASGLVRFDALEKPVLSLNNQLIIPVIFHDPSRGAPPKGGHGKGGGGDPKPKDKPPVENHSPRIPPNVTPAQPAEPLPRPPEDPVPGAEPTGPGITGLPPGEYDPKGTDGNKRSGDPSGRDGAPGGPGEGLVASYGISDPPVPRSRVDPVYPEMARQQGLSGMVILEIVIDEQGRVIATRIMRTDNVIFNKSAEDAVRQWKYSSPKNDGRAVRTYKTVTINFQLH